MGNMLPVGLKGKGMKERLVLRVGKWLVVLLFLLFVITPLFYMFTTSFKNEADIFQYPPKLLAFSTFTHYRSLLDNVDFIRGIINSMLIGVISALLSLFIGLPASYIIARFKMKWTRHVDLMVLMTRMAPPVVVLIPYFILFRKLDLQDTRISVILMHLTLQLSMVVWVSKAYFGDLSKSIEESALIDGATYWQVFMKIILPISLPLVSSLLILSFLFSWNEFIFSLVLTRSNAITAPVVVSKFMSYQKANWGRLMASSTLIIVPAVIFISLFMKGLIRGLTFGAVKE
jgi:multiple sugar transport system permease protein